MNSASTHWLHARSPASGATCAGCSRRLPTAYDFITVALSYGQDRRWKKRLIDLAGITSDDRVLDLACGTGDILFAAARTARFAAGLDLTFRMLQLAAAKPSRGRTPLVAGDMLALPFGGSRFTVVTIGYGLRNVPDIEQAIDEIHRVLAPGGRLLARLQSSGESCRPRRVSVVPDDHRLDARPAAARRPRYVPLHPGVDSQLPRRRGRRAPAGAARLHGCSRGSAAWRAHGDPCRPPGLKDRGS